MAAISQRRVRACFRAGDLAATSAAKGKTLEDLVCYLFEKCRGITVTRRNRLNVFATEEIDIAFWNEREASELHFLPHIILIECKNWSQAVSSDEVAWFDRKIHDRGLDLGILVAANGITGRPEELTRAHVIVAGALRDGRRLLVVTRAEIERLSSTQQLAQMLKEKLCDLAVSGTAL